MNKSQKRARLEGRLQRLGRLLGEKGHVGKLPRVLDIGIGLAANQIKQAADSIRRVAEAALARKRAEQLEKKFRRR